MTRPERRNEKKKHEKDFAAFCRITRQYFPDFVQWLQKMTDEFLDEGCVENLCHVLGMGCHEFLPHYVTINEFLSMLETGELERLRKMKQKMSVKMTVKRKHLKGSRKDWNTRTCQSVSLRTACMHRNRYSKDA